MVTFGSRTTVTMVVVPLLLKPTVKIGTLHTAYASMIMITVATMVNRTVMVTMVNRTVVVTRIVVAILPRQIVQIGSQ